VDFSIRTEYGILYAIAAVFVAAIVAYFYYKGSSAEGKLRWVLASLRFLSILFILLLFMSPVLSYLGRSEKKPLNIILVDNSKSTHESGVEELSKLALNAGDNADNESRVFLFSDGITSEVKDASLANLNADTSANNKTNLSKAFQDLKEILPGENISSVTVISDGIFNEGRSPVQTALALGAPVNFLLAGDTAGGRDLSISNVLYNKTAYIESSVPVRVELRSRGLTGTAKVRLYEDGRLADTREITLEPGKVAYSIDFAVSSPEQKTALYKLQADSLDGEVTFKNNFKEFFIKYIDNRFRVLVLAGGPSSDLAFAKERISRIRNFDPVFRTQKSPGEYYEGPLSSVTEYDAVILFGYPNSSSDDAVLSSLRAAAERTNLPLIFFASRNTDLEKLRTIEDRLPFTASSFSQSEEETSLSTVTTTATDFFKDGSMLAKINSLPAIFRTGTVFTAKPDAQTLVISGRSTMPALVISGSKDRRSAAFLAYGFYKWRIGENVTTANDVLDYLLTNIVSSVVRKDAGKKFSIETSSPVYSKNEDVSFKASITGHEVIGGEQIKVRITGPQYEKEFSMNRISANDFVLSEKMQAEGVYDYEATMISEGRQLETVTGKFLVGVNNFEYLETKPNANVLNDIANTTGGKRLDGMNNSEMRKAIEETTEAGNKELLVSRSFDLNINPYFLGLIIILLSAEWFLRKRNNLP
jgi:hypothetical protein